MGGDRGGLKCVQGKGIVNSIRTEGGRGRRSWNRRELVQRYGAAVVVMAFDEAGAGRDGRSANSPSASAPIASYRAAGFAPEDIIFDPNIFAIGTGIEEHNNYAVAYIEAVAPHPRGAAARACVGRRLEPVLRVSRQRAGAAGDAHRVSLSRHPGGHGHGHRQRRPAWRSMTTSTPSFASFAKTLC